MARTASYLNAPDEASKPFKFLIESRFSFLTFTLASLDNDLAVSVYLALIRYL